jgi:hypothetical protein
VQCYKTSQVCAAQASANNSNPALENEVTEALLKIEGQLDKAL